MDFAVPFDWPGGSWEATLLGALLIIAAVTVVVWTIALAWTFSDVRQRTSNIAVQAIAVLTVGVLFLPGLWVYRALRPRYLQSERYERRLIEEALLRDLEDTPACPKCRGRVRDDFLYCPTCFAVLKERCADCAKPLARGWGLCPYCGFRPAREVAEPAAATALAEPPAVAPLPIPAIPVPPQRIPQAVAARLIGQRTVLFDRGFERADEAIVAEAVTT